MLYVNHVELSFDGLDIIHPKLLAESLERQEAESDNLKNRVEYVIEYGEYYVADTHIYDDFENGSNYLSVIDGLTFKPIIVSESRGSNPLYE